MKVKYAALLLIGATLACTPIRIGPGKPNQAAVESYIRDSNEPGAREYLAAFGLKYSEILERIQIAKHEVSKENKK